jgi:hypothetical protein
VAAESEIDVEKTAQAGWLECNRARESHSDAGSRVRVRDVDD